MRFLIAPSEDVMTVDNSVASIDGTTFGLDSNISFVCWNSLNGGEVEFNDRPAVHHTFSDPGFYEAALNTWITSQAAASPALQLAQAQDIKISFIEGIFNARRQAPLSLFNKVWETDDEALAAMQAEIATFDIVSDTVSALNEMVAEINAMTATTATTTTTTTGTTTATGTTVGTPGFGTLNFLLNPSGNANALVSVSAPSAVSASSSDSSSASSSSSNTTINDIAGAAPAVITNALPTIAWYPKGAIVTTNLTLVQMRSLITAIQNRRTTYQAVRAVQKNSIAGLSSITSVVAYQVGIQWPIGSIVSTELPQFSIADTIKIKVAGVATPSLGTFSSTGFVTTSTNISAPARTLTLARGTPLVDTGWQTLASATMTTTGVAESNNTIAVAIEPTSLIRTDAGSKIRITLSGNFTLLDCFIGPRAISHPNGFDPTTPWQRVTFASGNHGVTVASTSVVSDILTFGVDGTNGIVVKMDFGTASNLWINTAITGWSAYVKTATLDASTLTATGYTKFVSDKTVALSKVESFYP